MKKTKKIIVTFLAAISLLSLTACSGEIQNSVVDGYQKVEDFFVDGYKTVENFFVSTYHRVEKYFVNAYKAIEYKFVGCFLIKDGETTETALERLKGKNN